MADFVSDQSNGHTQNSVVRLISIDNSNAMMSQCYIINGIRVDREMGFEDSKYVELCNVAKESDRCN